MKIRYINLKIIVFICLILIVNILLTNYVGKKYLNRLNTFIKENNNIILKNEINNIIRNNIVNNVNDLYIVTYNSEKEIISLNLDINKVNNYLKYFTNKISNKLNDNNYSKYITDYFKVIKINDYKYILMPMGILSNNPLIYNAGPKIIMSYDYINTFISYINVTVENYGLNNALINVYINIDFEQSITKPILSRVSKYNYHFLLSSKIINGRVPNFLGGSLNTKSDSISIT